ncbi:WD40-repeat-containing domain protein [Mycena metata]|uniref:WD40-repeat-containing domain protein n=1 Tax=Mycena metata TaxID=1033252 RepID=A0AAD7K316_9AGAR|nr:WD40-repeat-containing domain protein [Mycena metata]
MTSSTIYIPVLSPPTPAASPGPDTDGFPAIPVALPHNPALRQQYLASLLHSLTPGELLFVSTTIAPLLKRDFIADLPTELALMVLACIDEPRTLARASRVSRRWKAMVADESVWRGLCIHIGFGSRLRPRPRDPDDEPLEEMEQFAPYLMDPAQQWLAAKRRRPKPSHPPPPTFSYYQHFKQSYRTMMNWRTGGTLLRAHRMNPTPPPPNAQQALNSIDVITSVALDADWVVVGLANSKIHVFSSRTGVLARTLVGHDAGVWGPNALVVSGGCDKVLRVWDVRSGYPIHVLSGHTSTIRCLRMLHNRPLAVTGSRDSTLRVWDVQRGRMVRVMAGHSGSVRCLDVCGNRAVSGSYDATCRVWDVDTGECMHVLRGHFHQIYSVAFDGVRIASGGLDTTVRVWDALTGQCLALLQGHTALVCQLQLSPSLPTTPHPAPILVTGGSDGRVITFSLNTYTPLHRIAAHDSSVTSLQFDGRWLVTAGNDGRVRLWEIRTGTYVRELSEGGESVWKVCFGGGSGDAEMGLGAGGSARGGGGEGEAEGEDGEGGQGHDGGGDVIAIMCKRAGKSVMEIWSFRPEDMPTASS